MKLAQKFVKVEDINQELLDRFLEPYLEHCKYLKKAQFKYPELQSGEAWTIEGDFAIPESCYIDDTGHFNSVEFNICFTQLFYVAIAHLLQNNISKTLAGLDLETYKHRQLSNFLIVKFSSSFKKTISASNFQGTLQINRCTISADLIIMDTTCAFTDNNKGKATGKVTIAVLKSKNKEKVIVEPKEVLIQS